MTRRKKRGRPPFLWHGQGGQEFEMEVHVLWAERKWERRPITKAHAIRPGSKATRNLRT